MGERPGVLVPSTITTTRLTLTPLVEDDAESMVTVLDDVRMHEFTGGAPLTLPELRSRYRQLAVGRSADSSELWFNWIVRVAADGRPVGVMQATVAADGSSAEVAWEVGTAWQRRGFASEAAVAVAAWLGDHDVHDVRALVHPEHLASQRIAERIGLVPTGEVVDGEVEWRLPSAG